MHKAFQLFADNPRIGTDQGWIRPGYRRLVYESHVIYYQPVAMGVLIVEILHKTQDPLRHIGDEI